ncbi:MAG: type IV pilus biogenesis/stability protein PilW [Gammaproteobacteria bacterium]
MLNRPVIFLAVVLFLSACATDPGGGRFGGGNMIEASRANSKLGLGYMMQGNNEIALSKLQKAIEQDDKNDDAHHYIAELYNRLDEPVKADKHYKRALQIAPENFPLLNNYGVFLCRNDRFKESMAVFEKILANPLFKSKAQTYENMGLCAEDHGNIKMAEEYFRNALRFDARLPTSLLHLAQINFDNESFLSAYGFYQRYLEVGPQIPQSLWLGILLERRKGNKNAVSSYSLVLKNKFGESNEAELLRRLEARETQN